MHFSLRETQLQNAPVAPWYALTYFSPEVNSNIIMVPIASPELIRPRNCVSMEFTSENPPLHDYSRLTGSIY